MILLVDAEASGMDPVFKALADPTRRLLLDQLRERDGQTLGELCAHLEMARQSATQHLDVLRRANLVTVVRRGRERLHHLNPVPIHQIQERWISAFDRPRLSAISAITQQAEEQAMATSTARVPDYVYVTYIRASADQVWHALTDADLTARYWGHANVSDWQTGSTWEHRRTDGSGQVDVAGRVLESSPPTRLVITFQEPTADPDAEPAGEPSIVTFLVEPHEDIVRLTVTHERLADQASHDGVSHGWPAVLANLKSLLETGQVLPAEPWGMAPVRGGRPHADV
ncbi:metalloregulator ArsR/SmtB family transcription factor [Modestobacter sp. VKM Ac-2983]|uniref:ArsR/SmtB family transcription factor n=1 Tax=Modestobacter sp. VKM Ac-2983 TaxID=3004137 RepID=UPI0022ABA7F2|nr:metalloregulator ArsR/SmtB family transcription factor [Modestobacter sp. VKM Ac-2983]MCZ2805684.1 metalloregulator ArsR/SmtB family transcription factor [Modestobacter sp. VKM Ac-2983]